MMKVEIYQHDKHNETTAKLVTDYFKETLKDRYRGSSEDSERFLRNCVTSNHYIYVVIEKDRVVGFVIMYKFNMYGFSVPYIVVDHMYVDKDYRNGRAILWLYTTVGKVMDTLGLPAVGTTYVDSSNKHNNELVNGEVIANVTWCSIEAVKHKYKQYMKGLKAK